MKKNPAQVIITGLVSHLAVPLSNSNLPLSQTMSNLAKKAGSTINEMRCRAGLLDAEESVKLVPRDSPKLDNSFAKSQIEMQLRDITVLYTPVLSRSNLESAFGMTSAPAGQQRAAFDLLGD